MSKELKNLNRLTDINHLLLCYLKTVFPLWETNPSKLNELIKLLGNDKMTIIRADIAEIKQYCNDHKEINPLSQLMERSLLFKKQNSEFIKKITN